MIFSPLICKYISTHHKPAQDASLYQPPNEYPVCLICWNPLPVAIDERVYLVCCDNVICGGCFFQLKTKMPGFPCPFCRQFMHASEMAELIPERRRRGDAEAILHEIRDHGVCGHKTIRELFTLIEQGSAEACVLAALAFYHGLRGMHANLERAEECFKLAVLRGYDDGIAHYYLGSLEFDRDNLTNAFRHLLVAVSIGCNNPIIEKLSAIVVRQGIRLGLVSKEEYDHSLRSLQLRQTFGSNIYRALYRRQHEMLAHRRPGNTLVITFIRTRPWPVRSRLATWAPTVNHYWGLTGEDDMGSTYDEDDLPPLEEPFRVPDAGPEETIEMVD